MDELEKAAAAIAAGNRSEAHQLLAQAIKADPNNVDAWLLLSRTAALPEQQKTFLKRALIIDPDNETARARLAELEGTSELIVAAEPPLQEESGPPESSTVREEESTPVAEILTPTPDTEAGVATVEAPVFMPALEPDSVTEQEMEPELLEADAAYSDPFDFDFQDEMEGDVPAWLLGEVAQVEDEPEELEVITLALPTADQPETSSVVAAAQETMDVAGETTLQAAVATRPTKAPAARKKTEQSRSTWLEWLAILAFVLLFLLLVYLLVGGF